jgi:hypothetical protein
MTWLFTLLYLTLIENGIETKRANLGKSQVRRCLATAVGLSPHRFAKNGRLFGLWLCIAFSGMANAAGSTACANME